ncbi:hypothetical protein HN588_13550, partial [Candidatus Bathyarchaeota archaeon]|nr:hypothetical protein [Candidatus Bathyarchaeota archaeon]
MITLKVGSRCGYCLLHRGYNMIKLSTDDEAKRFEAMDAMLTLMGTDFGPDTIPSILGNDRGVLITRITGCQDP